MNLYLVREKGERTRVFSPGGEELFPDKKMRVEMEEVEDRHFGIDEDSCTIHLSFSEGGLGPPPKK